MCAVRILFIYANPPDDTERILPEAEFRNLLLKLRSAQHRTAFELQALPAARIGDLLDELRQIQPHIVHIACHGEEDDGSLVLTARTNDRKSALLLPEDLAETLRAYQSEAAEKIRLVVLAGCWTDAAARAVSRDVDAAIGMDGAIDDLAVVNIFTPEFYKALGAGRSVANAVKSACATLQSEHRYGDADMVHLRHRRGIDPKKLLPLEWDRPALSPAHLAYLRSWFGKPWRHVSLADIVKQRQEKADLLKIYVPLRVDLELIIQVKDQRIIDWSIQREEQARANEITALIDGATQPTKIRTWADLGVGEGGLQAIVAGIQSKIDERRAADKNTEDGDHSWYMEAHDAASVQPRFVLLGEPGSGKSSFLRHLTLCLAGELRRRAGDEQVPPNADLAALRDWLLDAYTPIFVEMRDLVARCFPELPATEHTSAAKPGIEVLWRYLREHICASHPAFAEELEHLAGSGKAILLFDGLDEVPDAADPQRRIQIQSFMAALVATYPALRIIVTSRLHAYRRGEWALAGFGRTEMRPLSLDRLRELALALFPVALGAAAESEAESFIAAIRKQLESGHVERSFYAIPLFFTLLAALWLNSPLPRRLPATRADLYRQAVDLLLDRWTQPRTPDLSVAKHLGVEPHTLRGVLETLACTVHEQSQPGQDTTIFPVDTLLGLLFRSDDSSRLNLRKTIEYLEQNTGLLGSPEPIGHKLSHLAVCQGPNRPR